MAPRVFTFVGPNKTVIVLEPDASDGPFLPLSVITDIGYALITAATTAQGRAAIAAASRGANADITEILGMDPVDTADKVLTPLGTANGAVLAAMLAPFVPVSSVVTVSASSPALTSWGVVWGDTTSAEVDITVDRTLGTPNAKSFIVMLKAGANPLVIKDDAGAIKATLLTAGQSFAIVSVYNNTVVVGGAF